MLFLERGAAIEIDRKLLVVLRRNGVSAGGSSRKHSALFRARRPLLVEVGVVVLGDLVKRAPFLRVVLCLSSRLPALPRMTVVPLVVGLAGQGAAAPMNNVPVCRTCGRGCCWGQVQVPPTWPRHAPR